MQNPEHGQRSSGMEDSEKTIEYLRARLLSERSVSSTARQRADELAERVSELEEQLRIVSLQRKKAEKATADVLAILETEGISDASEPFYSSSDEEETPDGPTRRGSSTKGGSSQELSEVDSLALSGRSLSWKGRKESSHPPDKYKDSSRRRSSFASVNSSGKHRQGKSCRQIKRREHRSETSEFVGDSTEVESQKNEAATSSEGHHHVSAPGAMISNGETKSVEEKTLVGVDEANAVNEFLELNGYGVERDMETALEHQAQLIDQYEAMEKVQREWEEKYRENNSSTTYLQDSYDPGNHSDITEEREESKPHTTYQQETAPIPTPEAKSELRPTSNGFNQASLAHKKGSLQALDKKSPFPIQNGSRNQEMQQNHHHPPSYSSKPESCAVVPHQTSNLVLGGVLDNLKRAKLLLQKHMVGKPPQLLPGPTVSRYTDKMDIPGGFPGLFRLPTDFLPGPSRGNNFLLPGSGLCVPESSALIIAAQGRSLSSHFVESSRPKLYGDEAIVATTSSSPYHRFSNNVAPKEGLERFSFDLTSSAPAEDQFLFQSDRGMNMMYR